MVKLEKFDHLHLVYHFTVPLSDFMSNMNKTQPLLSKANSYDNWIKLAEVWRKLTLEPGNWGPATVLTIEGEMCDAVLQLETSRITKPASINRIITRLNKIYKKDKITQKCNALEAFKTYRCKSSTVRDFLTKFEKWYHKTKSYGTTISEDVLTYRLLKAANLPICDKQLVRATITEQKYDAVKTKVDIFEQYRSTNHWIQ